MSQSRVAKGRGIYGGISPNATPQITILHFSENLNEIGRLQLHPWRLLADTAPPR